MLNTFLRYSAMAMFLSGPPGGRTLPHTATRLSDLAGGVYGLGSSVASTGLNAIRPVIRAASARQAGENWDDVLEYYVVRRLLSRYIKVSVAICSTCSQSLTLIEAKWILHFA